MLRLYNFVLFFGKNKRGMEQAVWAESLESAKTAVTDLYENYDYTWELADD